MKLLISGARGQVGTELTSQAMLRGHEVHAFGSKALDISHLEQVEAIVLKLKPDVVLNAAAYTAVDKAETESDRAYAVNSQGSENLALVCKKINIPLLHISTDYVYDGEKTSPYVETDPANPIGIYGASKLDGDQKIEQIWSKHIIVRVSWVFGEQGNNFVKTMLRLAEQRDELSIVDDQFGAPTSAKSIAACLLDIMESKLFNASQCPWGIYNFQSDPGVTWYEFAQEIFIQAKEQGLIDKTMTLKPIPSSEFPTPVKRPSNSKLNAEKLKSHFNVHPSNWKNELTFMLKAMLNNSA